MNILEKYFPDLSANQLEKFALLEGIYRSWNEKINVISRKDLDNFYERHVLHSLGIAKFISFSPGSVILDLGTGGGFPGIPLAIFFPDAEFHLTDSIAKKIKVAETVANELQLDNVVTRAIRAEAYDLKCDFVVTRAVAPMADLIRWTRGKFRKVNRHAVPNGIIALKGGDLGAELLPFRRQVQVTGLRQYFEEPFFETKKLVYYHP